MIEALNVSAEVIAAIFGIAVTVVAIIVQLAATRYNHHITAMFIRGPINICFLSFFVGVTILCIWVAAYPDKSHGIQTATLWLVTAALLALLPYFGYVFTFISPLSIIKRVSQRARGAMRAANPSAATQAVDQLQDIARSAIDQGDRTIALAVCEAIRLLFDHYRGVKDDLGEPWFHAADLHQDPDFVSFENSARDELVASNQWFEAKLLHQYLNIIWLASPQMRDVAASVGIATQKIAVSHINDDALFGLCSRAMNSLLRASINSGDARTAYHLLSQYRSMAEFALDSGKQALALRAADSVANYGSLAYGSGQYFILEVAAYDLARLIEHAHKLTPDVVPNLLTTFLALDQKLRLEAQEQSLAGVRRAQIQVAVYFLDRKEQALAQAVVDDLQGEDSARLDRIIEALRTEQEALFWEFTPRGVNFAYLEPKLREQLNPLRQLLGLPT